MGAFDKLVVGMMVVAAIVFFNSVSAADPDLLQDVCVADLTSGIFINQNLKFVKIGVAVDAKGWVAEWWHKREAIKMEVKRLLVGEEAEERRNRAKALKETARKAVEEGGSSYLDLEALIKDLYRS